MTKIRDRDYRLNRFIYTPEKTYESASELDGILAAVVVDAHMVDKDKNGHPTANAIVSVAREKVARAVQDLVAEGRYDDARKLIDEYEELCSTGIR